MAKLITAKMVEERGACERQYRQFKRRFPKGLRVTLKAAREEAKRAVSHNRPRLDLYWAVENFLTPKSQRQYERFRDLQAIGISWAQRQQDRYEKFVKLFNAQKSIPKPPPMWGE
jgi:hypothetical protein